MKTWKTMAREWIPNHNYHQQAKCHDRAFRAGISYLVGSVVFKLFALRGLTLAGALLHPLFCKDTSIFRKNSSSKIFVRRSAPVCRPSFQSATMAAAGPLVKRPALSGSQLPKPLLEPQLLEEELLDGKWG
jgi:hypothetical protein